MKNRETFVGFALFSLLLAQVACGEVDVQRLAQYRPYSVQQAGDRAFFTSVPAPGKLHEFNIYELREGTDTPRALLAPEEAKKFRLLDRFTVCPGKPHILLYASAQLSTSPAGEWRNCLVLVDANSTGVKLLANNGRDNRNPSFSRDGKMVAFWSGSPKIAYMPIVEQNEGYALHVVDVETGEERELVKADAIPAASCPPSWSPDNKRIAFVQALQGAKRRIHLINVDGSGLVTPAPDENYEPEYALWLDDCRIVFTHTGGPGLDELNLKTGKVSTVKAGGYRAPLELTPDGKYLKTSYEENAGMANGVRVLRVSNLERVPDIERHAGGGPR